MNYLATEEYKFSNKWMRNGFPQTGASGFGTSETKGFKRDPNPPANTKMGLTIIILT